MRRLLARDHDVENRVKAALPREHPPEVAFGHRDRMGSLAAPVEDARDEAGLAQPARVGRAAVLALLHFQSDSLSGHDGRES